MTKKKKRRRLPARHFYGGGGGWMDRNGDGIRDDLTMTSNLGEQFYGMGDGGGGDGGGGE